MTQSARPPLWLEALVVAVVLGVIALAGGCGPAVYPGQEEAARLVWRTSYKASGSPPTVLWVEGAALDCHFAAATAYDGWRCEAGCCAGEADPWGWAALVARPAGYFYSGDDTLAHEYWHLALYQATGDDDYYHRDPGFGVAYGHPAGGAVDQAVALLKERGL